MRLGLASWALLDPSEQEVLEEDLDPPSTLDTFKATRDLI